MENWLDASAQIEEYCIGNLCCVYFFSSPSCHSVLHCLCLSIVCPFLFSSCIMKHLLLNFFSYYRSDWMHWGSIKGKKPLLIGTEVIKPGDVAGSRPLSERWSYTLWNKDVKANGRDQTWVNGSCTERLWSSHNHSVSLSAEWRFTTWTVEATTSCLAYLSCWWKSESQNLLHQLSHWFY